MARATRGSSPSLSLVFRCVRKRADARAGNSSPSSPGTDTGRRSISAHPSLAAASRQGCTVSGTGRRRFLSPEATDAKILIVGAGVIGSVYGAHLAESGDRVSVLAHGARTAEVAAMGLVARDVSDGHLTRGAVDVVADPNVDAYDLVIVAVTREQCTTACAALGVLAGAPIILLLGNNAGRADLSEPIRPQVQLGFPGVGGVLAEGVAAYVRIKPQPTALEADDDPRLGELASHVMARGFAVQRLVDMEGWLRYHAVLIACICRALGRCGNDTQRLGHDRRALRLMCAAITEGFGSLRQKQIRGLPRNLQFLQGSLLGPVAVAYWGRTMRSPNGELWFGAHARHAGSETRALSRDVLAGLGENERATRLRELLGGA